jgi:iron complex outermembrane receptor protein
MNMRFFSLLVCLLAAVASRAGEPQTESPLDELLATPISTAARYDQLMNDTAASVTIITSEEMARYGWHTLADVLSAVRGVYTSYDRGYTYLGVRGMGLPTDYNNRFLVLLDGHPLLEAVSGSIGIGTALGIDLSTLSRIEFVRGPSSVMYGTGAMFGVINLIPKDEGERSSLMVGAGNAGMQLGNARAAIRRGDVAASVAAAWQERNGGNLYFPEFDSPQTNGGVVRNRDFDDYRSLMATFRWRRLRMVALNFSRFKGVPTASWGTAFAANEEITDGRTLVGLHFDRDLGPGKKLAVRGHFDRFNYHGDYPGDGGYLFQDESISTRVEVETQYVWDPRPNHRVTIGAEWNRSLRSSYRWGDAWNANYANEPMNIFSAYAQSEWQPLKNVSVIAGASLDHYTGRDTRYVTPRAAVIARPNSRSTVKLLYGQGFRMPSVYESFYERTPEDPKLVPEQIRTWELVWDQRLTSDILASGSLFYSHMDDVLRQEFVDGSSVGYENATGIESQGVELQLDYRRRDGIWCYASYSWQRARENGAPMPNSPENLIKAGISTPTAHVSQAALEILHSSARRTLDGGLTGDATIANVNLTRALTRSIDVGVTVRNVFDTRYFLPGGPEHKQDAIEQDGRTFVLRMTVRGR